MIGIEGDSFRDPPGSASGQARQRPGAHSKLLGLATIDVTMRYAHLAASVLRDAIDVLERMKRGERKTGS